MKTPYAIVQSSFGGFWLYPGPMVENEIANRKHFDSKAEAEAVRDGFVAAQIRAITIAASNLELIAANKAKGY